ncbi:hypothetical protein D9611_014053 [Ephemerocybe angulata]|uniref:Uncharacterized protein n=1 Tax=Ephemerocybe angulata TaxID=980116 RepID=A0A8H5ERE9_9AGAR|nr:hypothetical protein D9611_014053 [Tulosesus angulatus]
MSTRAVTGWVLVKTVTPTTTSKSHVEAGPEVEPTIVNLKEILGLASDAEPTPVNAHPKAIKIPEPTLPLVLPEENMSRIILEFSKAIFRGGNNRITNALGWFFINIGSDAQSERFGIAVDVWQAAIIAGLMLLQRYRANKATRGPGDLLSRHRVDAVVIAAALIALQDDMPDNCYRSRVIDKELEHPKGTHDACNRALLKGLDWKTRYTLKDLEKFRLDLIKAWWGVFPYSKVANRPSGFYGTAPEDGLSLSKGVTAPKAVDWKGKWVKSLTPEAVWRREQEKKDRKWRRIKRRMPYVLLLTSCSA